MSDADASLDASGDTTPDESPDASPDTSPDVDEFVGCDAPFEAVSSPSAEPPYSGTAFVTNDLLTDADPTAFRGLTYRGTGSRTMYDRRPAAFVTLEPHLFDARFGESVVIEVQVNPEFDRAEAEVQANTYAESLGRIPAFLFRDIDTMWVHKGKEAFGGGNRNILIHTEQGVDYTSTGSLEEIFVHEATHTSLDAYLASDPRWLEAAAADGVAISTYARDNPATEDLSESVGPFLAARLRPERVTPEQVQLIEETMPNRLRFLRCQGWTMDLVP